jgi:hypothetical protein
MSPCGQVPHEVNVKGSAVVPFERSATLPIGQHSLHPRYCQYDTSGQLMNMYCPARLLMCSFLI